MRIQYFALYDQSLCVLLQDIDPNAKEESEEHVLGSLAKMTVLITHLIVEFAKNLPGFSRLDKEDQIVLLKVGVFTNVYGFINK